MGKMKPLRIAVIGIGSAGIQTLAHTLTFFPAGSEIVSIYDPDIKNLGIGESTNPSFTTAIERGLNFDILNDLDKLDGTYKLGTTYINWRDYKFTNPLIQGGIAVHFNTHKLAGWAIPRFKELWGDKFNIIEGTVESITSYPDTAFVSVDGKEFPFEYVFDCRGFPKEFDSNYHVVKDSTVNHCLVHNKIESVNPLYTGHRATKDGWMFEVALSSRNSFGYLFNDAVTDPAQAKINFANEIGVGLDKLDNISYKFKSYYTTKLINGRIIKNGNRAAFFEPMFANSLFIYDMINRLFWDFLNGKLTEKQVNNDFMYHAQGVDDMINFHYQGGSMYDTPFWQRIIPIAKEKIKNSANLERVRHSLQDQSIRKYYLNEMNPSWVFNSKSLIDISNNLGYNYFNKKGTM
jgi:hypothetical protein